LIRYRITIGIRLEKPRSASGFANAVPIPHISYLSYLALTASKNASNIGMFVPNEK
jgi:hypothetical protein